MATLNSTSYQPCNYPACSCVSLSLAVILKPFVLKLGSQLATLAGFGPLVRCLRQLCWEPVPLSSVEIEMNRQRCLLCPEKMALVLCLVAALPPAVAPSRTALPRGSLIDGIFCATAPPFPDPFLFYFLVDLAILI